MEENWFKEGLRFECRRCSFCCGKTPGFVFLSDSDIERLCSFMKLGRKAFTEKYCRKVTYYGGKEVFALIELENCDCILWDKGCSCYEARPTQCRTYPFWSWMTADEETWNECAKTCPGMNSGPLHSPEEIAEQGRIDRKNEEEIMNGRGTAED